MRQNNLFAKILVFVVFIFTAFYIDSFCEFSATCEDIREKTLRLHIIANSDSDVDQQIKLKIRDRILKESPALFYAEDINAKEKAKESLEDIERIVKDELSNEGYPEIAKVEYTNMFFDTRAYDDFTLPAGNYDAVRIIIGEGKGKNWWCVLYPNLCLPAAVKSPVYFTEKEVEVIESPPRYEVKFLIVELLEKFKKN